MKRTNLYWIGPLTLAVIVLLGSVYLRLNPNTHSTVARPDSAAPLEAGAEVGAEVGAETDHALPPDLPAPEALSSWSRTVASGRTSWILRWRSDARQAARVLSYLSTRSRVEVMEFTLTAGAEDEWIVEATLQSDPADGIHTTAEVTDSQAEAELARLLHGSQTEVSDTGDPESAGDSPILDILNGGTGSVRFHDGVTYQWVRDHDVLHLELSP